MSIFMQSRKVLRGFLSDIFLDKVQFCWKILQQISMENNFKFYIYQNRRFFKIIDTVLQLRNSHQRYITANFKGKIVTFEKF